MGLYVAENSATHMQGVKVGCFVLCDGKGGIAVLP
jgi:hypothetical protein